MLKNGSDTFGKKREHGEKNILKATQIINFSIKDRVLNLEI